MNFRVKFTERENEFQVRFFEQEKFRAKFGEMQNVTDGGYNRGFSEGYEQGLNSRTFEIWTITLADGTVVEKEVALL